MKNTKEFDMAVELLGIDGLFKYVNAIDFELIEAEDIAYARVNKLGVTSSIYGFGKLLDSKNSLPDDDFATTLRDNADLICYQLITEGNDIIINNDLGLSATFNDDKTSIHITALKNSMYEGIKSIIEFDDIDKLKIMLEMEMILAGTKTKNDQTKELANRLLSLI